MWALKMNPNETFEGIKNHDSDKNEFWFARDLQLVLDYSRWEKFKNVINKAKISCTQSKNIVENHFHQVVKLVGIGSKTKREIIDFKLSRYACYLIVQNGDSSKEVIAMGQTYFALKTREQELTEIFGNLSEDEKRLKIRTDLKEHNKYLAEAAKSVGVKSNLDFAIFQNHGYKGLYGGFGSKEIHKIKDLGGAMPEKLPSPEKSMLEIKNKKKKLKFNYCN